AEDPTSANTATALPPYVAYQGDGDVTAPVVYVNYGMPDDYDALAERGIDVRGKIVLARYGGGWRGLKPKLAQEHGAVGCLIYSDPADDAYAESDVYPKGGGRPPAGVQRGSVADMPIYPGDPLTPGVGATPGAKRLTRETAKTILKIPALPISYADATKIIASLEGPLVTGGQRGGLGLAYHWGGTDAVKVHLAVKSDWSLKPVYDVIATLRGSTFPDQWNGRGYLGAEGSGELKPLVNQAANDVLDPKTGVPSAERTRAAIIAGAYLAPDSVKPDLLEAAKSGGGLPLDALGSGSDYTTFLQHL